VGPVYRDGKSSEAELLRSAYQTSLQLAEQKGVQYISFPSISTGVYGYPLDEAAPIALREAIGPLQQPSAGLRKVVFVLFDDRTLHAYERALHDLIPG
jgi:O-acetyl-ADP-ribose deacetylase (regulator of RNase III)